MSEIDLTLAASVRDALAESPALTTTELSERMDVDPEEVSSILDQVLVLPDGQLEHVGPGQGGGWLSEEVAETVREVPYGPKEPTEIGFRWPDGELRDVVFDKDDPDHLARLGKGAV